MNNQEIYINEDRKCCCSLCELAEKCVYIGRYQRLPRDLYPGALNKCAKLEENEGKLQY